MRTSLFTITLLVLCFLPFIIFGQADYEPVKISTAGCLPQGITFSTQEEVDNFSVNYPGCDHITGRVEITGSEISNLNGLIGINRIEEYLYIDCDTWNFSFSGLDSLQYVGGFYLNWTELTSFEGLSNLDTIAGNFGLYVTNNLTDFSGLSNLKYIKQQFSIDGSNNLVSLNGLNNLNYIGEGIYIYGAKNLSDISLLNNLTSFFGHIYLISNDSIRTLPSFENIDINNISSISISNNQSLNTCNSSFLCEYLADPTGTVDIFSNAPGCNNPAEVASQCGFQLQCLPHGNYHITSQADADNFMTNYPGCLDLNGSLEIQGAISSLEGLTGVRSISGGLTVMPTTLLTNFIGLDSLKSIGWSFQLGYWEGGSNEDLVNFNGLENLSSIGNSFLVMMNPKLQSFDGLGKLKAVDYLDILGNEQLTSLEGLGLDTIRDHLEIALNPLLTECAISAVCQFIESKGEIATINLNGVNCNTKEEISEICLTGIPDNTIIKPLLIYPNPAEEYVMVDLPEEETTTQLSIFNISGQVVLSTKIDHSGKYIDIHSLPSAMYKVQIVGENGVYTGKVIVK